ncbi:hypothetical protein IMCC3317_45010 [Kordia antarctica]|uniref:Peptidoglycan binding-like domain-containing protein n=1 Tax=Kordia antarctica TaxID=1218801 RepID=A0A7L4ZRK1_9FLAO|nr:peptidoglycan-binding domain-containing protein [Kordia antarctica]QHI39100.1 hypothetical protein IMCC3317_45010 [Kordia antarctica]
MSKLKSLLTLLIILSNYLAISQSLFTFSEEKEKPNASSFEYTNANAFNITLDEIQILDIGKNFGPTWNVIFLEDENQMIYTRSSKNNNGNEIVVRDIKTSRIIAKFKGSTLRAVSPDRNRIFYDNSIYDIKQQKAYKINADIYNHHYWQSGTIAWIDDTKIIAYKNLKGNGVPRPYNEYYFYLDLDDLKIKKMDDQEINRVFPIIQSKKNEHANFYLYLYGKSDIYIQDKATPYSKSILNSPNGYPIRGYWTSKNLEYVVISKYSQRYTNTNELVLYKLKNTIDSNELDLFFTAKSPSQWLDDKFKPVFNQTNGVGVWADVYEAKVNPLNNKVVGPDKSKYRGTMKIVKDLGDNKIGLQVGRHTHDIKSGFVITNFKKDNRNKDSKGAWTTLDNWDYLKGCAIDFTKLSIGIDDMNVLSLHSILNSDPQTKVAKTGMNSPGNESSLFVKETTQAILKFQKLKRLHPTGKIDSATSKELNKVCAISMKMKALKRLN